MKLRNIPTLCITALCILIPLLTHLSHSLSQWLSQSEAAEALSYSFTHANIFHLALNLIALWQFRPRWKTCFVAYAACTLAYLLPFSQLDAPTCGLSGFLFAAYARKYQSHRLPCTRIVLVNVLLAFIPVFNWKIHLLSFFIAYAAYAANHHRRHRTR